MANFEAVTVSSYDIKIPSEQQDALRKLLAEHHFSEVTVELDKDGCLNAYGYATFDVYPLVDDEPDLDRDVTGEFLEALCPFIPEGAVWKVATVGNEKLRYVSGWVAKVSRSGVVHEFLDTP